MTRITRRRGAVATAVLGGLALSGLLAATPATASPSDRLVAAEETCMAIAFAPYYDINNQLAGHVGYGSVLYVDYRSGGKVWGKFFRESTRTVGMWESDLQCD